MKKFIIRDWMNNVCFDGKEFETYEDGWGFLYETFPNGDEDGTYDDYFVELKKS